MLDKASCFVLSAKGGETVQAKGLVQAKILTTFKKKAVNYFYCYI